jgi:hypothetical protein
MATLYKELIGRLDLVGSVDAGGNTYNLIVPKNIGTNLPHGLDNQVIEEVYIICDSTLGRITINLPSTTEFNGIWNAKIYIAWTAGANDVVIVPFEGSATPLIAPDTLNGSFDPYIMVALYETNYLHIVYDYTWMKLVCSGPII